VQVPLLFLLFLRGLLKVDGLAGIALSRMTEEGSQVGEEDRSVIEYGNGRNQRAMMFPLSRAPKMLHKKQGRVQIGKPLHFYGNQEEQKH
jgi:hypothetical protein